MRPDNEIRDGPRDRLHHICDNAAIFQHKPHQPLEVTPQRLVRTAYINIFETLPNLFIELCQFFEKSGLSCSNTRLRYKAIDIDR